MRKRKIEEEIELWKGQSMVELFTAGKLPHDGPGKFLLSREIEAVNKCWWVVHTEFPFAIVRCRRGRKNNDDIRIHRKYIYRANPEEEWTISMWVCASKEDAKIAELLEMSWRWFRNWLEKDNEGTEFDDLEVDFL